MSQSHIFNLDRYKERIGYRGPLEPSLSVLHALSEHHAKRVPFENLDVLMGKGIDLSPAALERKLIDSRRGGYCFEQNGFMLGILKQIGYEVTPLSARVRVESPREVLPPRTHLFLVVHVEDQEWIFDVGVGGLTLTSPILRHACGEQETRHERRRIVKEEGKWFHQAWTGNAWVDVYEYTGEEMPEIDREVANWWTSSSPKAKFSQRLVCALAADNGERLILLNDRFTRRRGREILESIVVRSADELLELLADRFGLDFPEGTRIGSGDKPWPTH